MKFVFFRLEPFKESADSGPVSFALNYRALLRARQLIERHLQRDILGLTKLAQLTDGPLVLRLGPRFDRAFVQTQSGIGNNQIEIQPDRIAKALTGRARAVGIVETEEPWLGLRVNRAVILALKS